MNSQQIGRAGWGMHDRWGDGGGHPFLALLCMVAIAAAIALVVWLIVSRRPHAPAAAGAAPSAPIAPSPTAAAESILAERLARSEISPEDYRAMLGALREQPPTA